MNNFAIFCKLVADYWPHRKTTEIQLREFWEHGIWKHEPGVFSAALSKALIESPAAPKWDAIFAYLASRSERDGVAKVAKSEFELLLNQSREAGKGDHVPGSGNLSDEDAWLRHLRVLTQSIRGSLSPRHGGECNPLQGSDCGLTGAECRARWQERNETSRWRQYLVDRGEPFPDFLLDGYERVGEFVEPKEPKTTLF